MKAKYDGIYAELKERIVGGAYPADGLMPSEAELVREFDCSHNTVRRALALLAEDGLVLPVNGKGVRVLRRPKRRTEFSFGGIESYAEAASQAKLDTTTEVALFEEVEATAELAEAIGFPEGERLWHIERVRSIDGTRLIRDVNYFSCEQLPGLTPEIAASSVYKYLENELGLVVAISNRVLTVELADERDRELLDMEDFDSLAVISGQMYTQDGLHVESTQSRHRQDYFSFSYTARRR